LPAPAPLPIDEVLPALAAALATAPNAVLRAPPGAGKTTRVPPFLLASGLAGGRVVVLEPRRIAARAAARRIADERGWTVGEEVGYQVRFERRARPDTPLLVVTEGILVQMLQADPLLEGIGTLVFDEVHERSLFTDLALALARRVQAEVRPDLRLLAMSATLETAPLAAFLGGAAVVESQGREHPVEVVRLPRRDERPLAEQVAAGVRRALAAVDGDVLVFLPGAGEVRACETALEPLAATAGLAVVPLFGDLPAAAQDAALRPLARRKVVLATNVAETSVTVDGVAAVVDSGLVRRLQLDPGTGLDRLALGRVSRASADQRAGRAGRQGPGWALRLWTEHDERGLLPYEQPEIARVDLAWAALQLLAWGERDPAAFGWLEPPPAAALVRALDLLDWLGARAAGSLTPLGRDLARLPLHPRLARLLLEGARSGCLAETALAAALLSERDPFRERTRRLPPGAARAASRSDLLDRVEALAGRTPRREGDPGGERRVRQVAASLAEQVERRCGAAPPLSARADREEGLLGALLAAYPDRVARRREPGSDRALLVGGRGARLAPASAVTAEELFVAVDLDAGTQGEALVRLASGVRREWLDPARLSVDEGVGFDAARERVTARRVERYADLVLSEREVPADPERAAEVLAEAAAGDLGAALPLAEPAVASYLARLRWLAGVRPELDLPAFGDEELRALLPALCAGRRSFAELRSAPLLPWLEGRLDPAQRAALAREAPERIALPSGNAVRLRYEEGRPPVLAARIQELFGLAGTPRVAGGQVPVLLHLLAPNQRPQQVTDDLAGFWARTYPQVRKELAGRYPKHAWPLDPLAAAPERRPQRR